jgi:hypothetical protein
MCTKIYERYTCDHVGSYVKRYHCRHRKAADAYKSDKGVSDQHTTVQLYYSRCKSAEKIEYDDLPIDCRRCMADEARRCPNSRRTRD